MIFNPTIRPHRHTQEVTRMKYNDVTETYQSAEAKLSPFDMSVLMKFVDTDRERCFIIWHITDFDTLVSPEWKISDDESEMYLQSLKLLIDIKLVETYQHPTLHLTPIIHLTQYGTDFVYFHLKSSH